MNKKHGLLFGFAVIALAAIFTLTGCPTEADDTGNGNGNGGDDYTGPSGTITLAQAGTNIFTLTLSEGLTWADEETLQHPGGGLAINMVYYMKLDGDVSASGADSNNEAIANPNHINHAVARTSDTVVTVTMSRLTQGGTFCFFGTGSLKLSDFSKTKFDAPVGDLDSDRGGSFMRDFTVEGNAFDKGDGVYADAMNGKLTVNSASTSVAFSFAKLGT